MNHPTPAQAFIEKKLAEFDENFPVPEWLRETVDENHMVPASRKDIKAFITSLLQSQREELAQQVEGLNRMESDYDDEDKKARRDVRPYNAALTDAAAIIRVSKES